MVDFAIIGWAYGHEKDILFYLLKVAGTGKSKNARCLIYRSEIAVAKIS